MCLRRPHVAKICSVEGWVVFIIKVRCVLNLALRETPLEVLNMASVNVLGVYALTGEQIARDLGPKLSSDASIYFPNTAAYADDVTPWWDTFIDPSYVVAIQPAVVADVQLVVSLSCKLPSGPVRAWK